MLFKLDHLLGIKSGKITLAFRKWKKPGVKPRGTQRNEMGVISIVDVKPVLLSSITETDAVNAGYDNRDDLVKSMNKVDKGTIYRIHLKYQSADPRIKLRQQGSLSDEELEKLSSKLRRLDQSTNEPWTMKYLKLIQKYPARRAGDLADMMKVDKLAFKLNVRKLKNLGLTISHEVGYSISPLGEWVMKKN